MRLADFVSMSQLLDGADVVVSSAGAGSALSALSAAHPMVLLPMGLDTPVNAARVAEAGAASSGPTRSVPRSRGCSTNRP
ncbi:nucleotide disphospho-sugar-binding domain-containing protein [Streptomyces sp. NPDC059169]|uniref:nucleotide disphospho-sugar-binding domain-containing protein n=1 Tax=unclassified Streptomyces TaxID=2593676 RepID=UPI00369FE04F